MGDLERACGRVNQAVDSYKKACGPEVDHLPYAREALAASTVDSAERCESWLVYGESLGGAARYLALEQAVRAARSRNLLRYVMLRVKASRALLGLSEAERRLLKEINKPLSPDRFVELALHRPDLLLAHIRQQLPSEQTRCLARFRLLSMLRDGSQMKWADAVRDPED
jgi:hypothetical protein